MFLKPLEAQSRGKTLEIIIAKRMQNMVRFENKNIIFVAKIHFGIGGNSRNCKQIKKSNLQKHMFLKLLEAQSRGKPMEMIIVFCACKIWCILKTKTLFSWPKYILALVEILEISNKSESKIIKNMCF